MGADLSWGLSRGSANVASEEHSVLHEGSFLKKADRGGLRGERRPSSEAVTVHLTAVV